MLKLRQHISLTNKVIHQKRRGLAVLCGEQLSFWCRVRKCDFLFGQVTSIHERRPEQKTNHRLTQVFIYMLSVINRCLVPDSVQKTCCDALSPHQTEDPDTADTTNGFFWDSGAAPSSVVLHEVLLVHVFRFLGLLQHPKGLGDTSA